jgi:hypothetical protein
MPKMTREIDSVRPELPKRAAGSLRVRTLSARVSPPPHDDGHRDRRNPASRLELLRRVEVEYREMPGLRLTLPQAQRLFGLRDDVCVRVLSNLIDQALLRRDASGTYLRNGRRP